MNQIHSPRPISLLVIDLQRDFLQPDGRQTIGSAKATQVLAAANCLIHHAQALGWSIAMVKNEFSKRDWIGNLFRNGSAIEGTPGAELDPRLTVPANAWMISKHSASAFTNPALERFLKRSLVHELVVLGVMTEACVRATATAACRLGFAVTLVCDGVASRSDWLHEFGLRAMRKVGVNFRSTEELTSGNSSTGEGTTGAGGCKLAG